MEMVSQPAPASVAACFKAFRSLCHTISGGSPRWSVMQGCQLEPDLGSLSFLALVGELLALSHVATVGLAAAAAKVLPELAGEQYRSGCAIGFSAVLFALKVILSYRTPGWSHVAGFELPTKVSSVPDCPAGLKVQAPHFCRSLDSAALYGMRAPKKRSSGHA